MLLPALLGGEWRFPPSIAWVSQECFWQVSAASRAAACPCSSKLSMLVTSPSLLLTCSFPSAIFKTPPGKSFKICNARAQAGVGWSWLQSCVCLQPGGIRPSGAFAQFPGLFQAVGKVQPQERCRSHEWEGQAAFLYASEAAENRKTVLYKLLSSSSAPLPWIRKAGDWGGGREKTTDTKHEP